ncbi:hypothetical protein BB561_003276 [Smittium simulii]|uniref:RlpA-like protein double-psi beta-barrel domain-containing protein n=1 Tax=Smittium simulii TaxID=133385 RepID=A0A2T9YM69_9FUNG|nr:hypothetical protein BB561_003276 [Smittium simulii]
MKNIHFIITLIVLPLFFIEANFQKCNTGKPFSLNSSNKQSNISSKFEFQSHKNLIVDKNSNFYIEKRNDIKNNFNNQNTQKKNIANKIKYNIAKKKLLELLNQAKKNKNGFGTQIKSNQMNTIKEIYSIISNQKNFTTGKKISSKENNIKNESLNSSKSKSKTILSDKNQILVHDLNLNTVKNKTSSLHQNTKTAFTTKLPKNTKPHKIHISQQKIPTDLDQKPTSKKSSANKLKNKKIDKANKSKKKSSRNFSNIFDSFKSGILKFSKKLYAIRPNQQSDTNLRSLISSKSMYNNNKSTSILGTNYLTKSINNAKKYFSIFNFSKYRPNSIKDKNTISSEQQDNNTSDNPDTKNSGCSAFMSGNRVNRDISEKLCKIAKQDAEKPKFPTLTLPNGLKSNAHVSLITQTKTVVHFHFIPKNPSISSSSLADNIPTSSIEPVNTEGNIDNNENTDSADNENQEEESHDLEDSAPENSDNSDSTDGSDTPPDNTENQENESEDLNSAPSDSNNSSNSGDNNTTPDNTENQEKESEDLEDSAPENSDNSDNTESNNTPPENTENQEKESEDLDNSLPENKENSDNTDSNNTPPENKENSDNTDSNNTPPENTENQEKESEDLNNSAPENKDSSDNTDGSDPVPENTENQETEDLNTSAPENKDNPDNSDGSDPVPENTENQEKETETEDLADSAPENKDSSDNTGGNDTENLPEKAADKMPKKNISDKKNIKKATSSSSPNTENATSTSTSTSTENATNPNTNTDNNNTSDSKPEESENVGEKYTGEGTHYDPGVGIGACGLMNYETELVAAINTVQYGNDPNPNNAAICNKCALINYTNPSGEVKKVKVTIVDRCPVCKFGDIDLSTYAFTQLAPLGVGRIKISWSFTDC